MVAKAATAGRSSETTRNAILEATSQLIAEKGVDGFAMSEVAERGRVNRALIYHYFQNRDNLVFETIRHIARRYETVAEGTGGDPVERAVRMHIEHPEIARFFFHVFLTGRTFPKLSSRLTVAIEYLEKLKAQNAPDIALDPAMGVLSGWLIQLSWSFARAEISRQLGISVEEADERMIRHLRTASGLVREAYQKGIGSGGETR